MRPRACGSSATVSRSDRAPAAGFILTMGCCAEGVATLPVIARRFPDAAIVRVRRARALGPPDPEGDADDARYLAGL